MKKIEKTRFTEEEVIAYLENLGYDFIDGLDFNKDMFCVIANEHFTLSDEKDIWIKDSNEDVQQAYTRYPEHLMKKVREHAFDLDENDKSKDNQFEDMTMTEFFTHVCQYDGLLGSHASQILDRIYDIFKIDLKQHSSNEYSARLKLQKQNERKVVAVWGISNTASLNVWEFSQGNDGILVGINNNTPEWLEIEYRADPDDDNIELHAGIDFHGTFYRLDECLKV